LTAGAAPPQPAAPGGGLRLRAEDSDDLAVISAVLQDALVAVRDLAYDPGGRSFILVANRFRWEGCEAAGESAVYERTLCAITFDEIDGVAYRGFHRTEEDRILALLAIRALPARAGTRIDLDFAGDATIRLTAAAISCRARDFGEPWPTAWRPGHKLDEAG
jgi:Protein of unknown function (DUF2948)